MYIYDVWASSTTPSAVNVPQLRINTNFGYLDFNITSHFVAPFAPFNTGSEIKSAPKAYSSVNQAAVGPAFTTVPGFVTVEFLQPSVGVFNTNANITIHRLTVTEYNTP